MGSGINTQKSFDLGGAGTLQHPTNTGLFGDGEGIAIDGNRALPVDITYDNFYVHGNIVFGGRIAASPSGGLKEGRLTFAGQWHSRLALAMKLQCTQAGCVSCEPG
ncbi:uncharacterized protein ACHE_31344A [Aspergillus chevalieri]|uniref:Uncharacterized protein n=1 Tax=Aspergillus chevalieri TaxID=182096 RepID=A0A7R7VMC5_ASPCH|nr:uncharacterized protein ACHE_31344A [Aspergillus chevalieri]BCR87357.1 hypothetical protein ACHE_31344A [Aspergillus chevalieri]